MRKTLIASLALLAFSALVLTSAHAANTVEIVVLQDGEPVMGAPVEAMATDGSYSGVTDENGVFILEIPGKYFRLRVMDTLLEEIYQVEDSPIVVDLNEL